MIHQRRFKRWQGLMLPDESIVHSFGVSWLYLVFFWLIPAFVALFIAVYALFINVIFGFLFGLVTISAFIPVIYLRYFVHYAITDHRVMTREGFLHRKFVTADLPSVTDVTVKESFFERLLTGTGVLGINTAGSNHIELYFKHVRRPFELRKDIYRHQYKIIEERKLMTLQKSGHN